MCALPLHVSVGVCSGVPFWKTRAREWGQTGTKPLRHKAFTLREGADCVAVFKYLKGYIPTVVLIVFLLIGQVICDLAIPTFTGAIVDVGIQQGGVADGVLSEVSQTTLNKLCDAMSEADAQTVRSAYHASESDPSVLVLDSAWSTGENRTRLDDLLRAPEVALYDRADESSDPGADPSDDDASLQEQRAAAFVLDEYRALGMDVTAMQVHYLLGTGVKMLGVALLGLAIAIAVGALASRTAAFIARDLRSQLFSNVLSFSRAEMQAFSPASLITRCTNDIQQIQGVIVMVLRMVVFTPIMGIAASVMVAITAPGIAWVVAVAVVTIIAVVLVLMRFTLPRFRIMQKLIDRVNLVSREILTGVAVVRAFGREQHEEKRFDEASGELMRTSLFTARAMSLMMPIMMLIMNVTAVAIIWFGGFQVQAGSVQVGDLIVFINYATQVCMSFMMIAMISIMLPRAEVAADRVNEVIATHSAIHDPAPQDAAPTPAGGWTGEVRYENVGLHFADAEANVLSNVSFTVRPGTTTAIIGPTGSGKSTLVRLLPRLYDVSSGRITVDGVDIRSMRQQDLRSLIGYVPQKAVLFSGTVRSNIAYVDPAMPFERVKQAADVAQATEFVEAMDGAWDAPIAQGGSNVSGGQRQRLSIARAVAAEPRIFIFDDSFSALDFATEATVRAGLKDVAADAAVIVVAQRVASILDAEQIVVLEEGAVAGVGTHLELMEGCAAYREIATSQLSEEELATIAAAMKGGAAR